ncbi:MAG TPA: DUF1116 domain-containing protein [Anaeromyxobacteraceae bacterium]|nr:DUF1116 domain-containing protein [Anaeromyxobacteraceae bacterium]
MTVLSEPLGVINVGLEGFRRELEGQGIPVVQVDWRPPAGGDRALIELLSRLERPEIDEANARAVARMTESRPVWIDVERAGKAIPGLEGRTILHAGPAIEFGRMCDPQQRAVEGAARFEGWVSGREDLERQLERGEIVLRPNHLYGSVGAMTGVLSPSMPVVVAENEPFKNRSFSPFNEGKGNVIWLGAFDESTFARLRWLRDEFGPLLRAALRRIPGGLDIFKIVSEGIQMGDEVHARSAACTLILQRLLAPLLVESGASADAVGRALRFIGGNNHFFLSLTLTACKCAAEAAHGIEGSTVVTAMTRNGVDFAIRVGGLGDRWFVAKAPRMDEAIYYSGYTVDDAAGDIGDSAIVETAGLGGMIIGAAPSIASFVGGTMAHARRAMGTLRRICVATNPRFAVGAVDFTPAPVGIDIRKVVRTGVTPFIDTGVLHKASGVGQIGTGIARAPLEVFVRALEAFASSAGR